MGEEARDVDLAVVQENSSRLEDGEVNREAGLDLTASKNKSTEVPDEGGLQEQEELSEEIEVRGRIQVLHWYHRLQKNWNCNILLALKDTTVLNPFVVHKDEQL